jgi:hypothetical protein
MGVRANADWDQRHLLNVVAGHRRGRYTLGGRFHLHSGRPVTIDGVHPLEFGRLPPFYQQRTPAGIRQDAFRIVLPSLGVRGEL